MKKKLLEGTHEEVISCLKEGMQEILDVFYFFYKVLPYQEFKELKRIYATLETLIRIELQELEHEKSKPKCTA